MIRFLVLLSFLIANTAAHSQITYFDADWKPSTKEDASYFRVVHRKDSLWEVKDYFMTNQVQMSGTYADDSLKIKHGRFVFYHDNGQKSSEGDYVNGHAEGPWTHWHANGMPDGSGIMKNDEFIGVWKWYFDNGKLSAEETYIDSGEFVKGVFRNRDGRVNKTVKFPRVMPEFKGGEKALLNYLQKNIRYPDEDRIAGNEGRVMVGFVVTEEGNIKDLRVLKSVSPTIDNEAIRVVGLMPKWKPGLQHNRPVPVRFALPVDFRLK